MCIRDRSFIGSGLLVFWSGWDINEKMLIALLLGYIVYIAYHFTAKIELPPMDFKHGAWFPVWVIGLMVISWLGNLDGDGKPTPGLILDGGNGPLDLVWGAVVVAIFCIAVYYLAMAFRLPSERAAFYISHTPTDEPGVEPEEFEHRDG